MDVAGSGTGATVSGAVLPVRVTREGPFEGTLRLVGPDGVLAETDGPELVTTAPGDRPGWLAAAFEGGPHPLAPEMPVVARTAPVHVEVDGRRSARAEDARWCLGFLDRFAAHLDEHGRFADDPTEGGRQRADHAGVLDRARAFYRSLT